MRTTLFTLLLPAIMTGCSTMTRKPSASFTPPTVRKVDLDRYMGEWFVIAAVPYSLEKGKVATSDIYRKRADGKMDNIFAFREGSFEAPQKTWEGTAWVIDHETNATWKVRLFWPLTATYRILHLDPDYRWSVVSNGNGKLVWILSKDRQMPKHQYLDILEMLERDGFEASRLQKVPQPEG